MRMILSFLVMLALYQARAESFKYRYDGRDYEISITPERLHQCPDWDQTKQDNPPLAARKALEKARSFIERFPAKNGNWWEFQGLTIVEITGPGIAPALPVREGWVWRARYQLRPPGGGTGFWPTIDCYVLMDGTVVEPTVTPRTPGRISAGEPP